MVLQFLINGNTCQQYQTIINGFGNLKKMLELLMSNVLVHRVKGIRDLLETGLFRQLVFEPIIILWFLL